MKITISNLIKTCICCLLLLPIDMVCVKKNKNNQSKKEKNKHDFAIIEMYVKTTKEERKKHEQYQKLEAVIDLLPNNQYHAANSILKKNTDLFNIKDMLCGLTILMYIIKWNPTIDLEILNDKNIDVNITDDKKNTALDYAIGYANKKIALKIINHDSFDINKHRHSLEYAIIMEDYEIAQALQELLNKNKNKEQENKEIIHVKNTEKIAEKSIISDKNNKKNEKQGLSACLAILDSAKLFFEKINKRVSNWENNPKDAYLEHLNMYEKVYSSKDYDLMVKYHTFSKTVDLFMHDLAIKTEWKGNDYHEGDSSYNIPGQLIFTTENDETTVKTGVFSFGISKNAELFHRCFSERTYDFENKSIKTTLEERIEKNKKPENNFTITTPTKEIKKALKLKPLYFKDKTIAHENSFYVEIIDKKNDMTIRLFKTENP